MCRVSFCFVSFVPLYDMLACLLSLPNFECRHQYSRKRRGFRYGVYAEETEFSQVCTDAGREVQGGLVCVRLV